VVLMKKGVDTGSCTSRKAGDGGVVVADDKDDEHKGVDDFDAGFAKHKTRIAVVKGVTDYICFGSEAGRCFRHQVGRE